ncbi:MAG TPA: 3-deoxy-manno-octulosonate cytidylyltransferase [Candidatus Polarisedimenticolaceae bacterium]|nr:3-deoxy-manno-octulosonate cytidylyltransferase [Candidatus Polarisedimenticolaceae bacterium]
MLRVLGVIPARFASTRFPGKPLAPLGDRTMLQHVWEGARSSRKVDRLMVATEDPRVVDACAGFGAESMLTSPDHPSGTDRVAEVVERTGEPFDVVLNIQGDEPFVSGASLDRLVEAFGGERSLEMATLAEPLLEGRDLFDPHVVKVVMARDGRALYFSRSPIPFHRGTGEMPPPDFRTALASRPGGLRGYWKHQGIYAYTPAALFALREMPPSPLERDEGLEQLRALQAGFTILVLESDWRSLAVDTPDDLARAVARLAREEIPR